MKQLITAVSDLGLEYPLSIQDNLDAAIQFVKKKSLVYFGSSLKIYPLEHPLTVRYLDNKFFID